MYDGKYRVLIARWLGEIEKEGYLDLSGTENRGTARSWTLNHETAAQWDVEPEAGGSRPFQ